MASPPPAAKALRRRRLRLGCQTIALGVIALLCVLVGYTVWQWHAVPRYWQEQQARRASQPVEVRDQIAESLQQRVVNEVTRIRPIEIDPALQLSEGVRHIHLSEDEVNDWLERRAPAWLAHWNVQLPREIGDIAFTIDKGQLVLAFAVDSPRLQQVVSLRGDLKMLDDGRARIKLDELRVGRLRVPIDFMLKRMAGRLPPQHRRNLEQIRQAFDGLEFEPWTNIDDLRQARLLDVAIAGDGLDVTFRVEPRPDAGSRRRR